MTFRKLRRTHAEPADQAVRDESGQGLAEYGLILALVAVVCIGALGGLGSALAGSAGFVNLPSAL